MNMNNLRRRIFSVVLGLWALTSFINAAIIDNILSKICFTLAGIIGIIMALATIKDLMEELYGWY